MIVPLNGPDPQSRLCGCELLGRGFTSDVYAWDQGRVLKLFHPGTDASKAEREYAATTAVHALGLPVPVVHEFLEVDGRHGIVMERVSGVSLLQWVQAKPWLAVDGRRTVGRSPCPNQHMCRSRDAPHAA